MGLRVIVCLLGFFIALSAQGQTDSTRKQPPKGGLPPANVPAQRVPDAPSGTPSGNTPASRTSTNNPAAGATQSSDLEQELNQKSGRPNRLGPERSTRTNRSANRDSAQIKAAQTNAQSTTATSATATATRSAPATAPTATAAKSATTAAPTATLPKSATTATIPTTTAARSVTSTAASTATVPKAATATAARSATTTAPTTTAVKSATVTAPTATIPRSATATATPTVTTTRSATTTAPVTTLPRSATTVAVPSTTAAKSATSTAAPTATAPKAATATAARSTTATTTPTVTTTRSATTAAQTSATATAARSATTTERTTIQPGLVTPNVVRPESRTAVAQTPSGRPDSVRVAVNDSVGKVPAEDETFKTTVNYQAKDSTIYAADGQTVELFGDASVVYGDISLKAEYIRLNYITNEVYAKGRYDSTAQKLIGRPIFQDGEGKYDTKEIRYNFKTKKGRIQGVVTQQGEGNIRGVTVKKDSEDNLYIGKAIYTTCNLATPHFHINASKLKVIHNKQVVAGPFNLVINQIPLPIGLPFGFFPFPKRKEIGVSGILVPQYGEEPNGRGFYLRDGGYYWAVNENLGLQFKGQIYSRGSWGVGLSSAYNKRYTYSGGVDLRFNRNRSGDPVDPSQSPRNDFAFTWSHSPVPRGRGSFSANVNVSSNSYNQFNSYTGTNAYISNVAGSSVQYSRQFGQFARAGANVRVNQQFGQVNPTTGVRENGKTDVSSDFNFGINQIAPFALRGGTGRWYESFRVGLDVSGSITVSNTVRTQVDTTGLGFPVITNLVPVSALKRIQDSTARAIAIRDGRIVADPNLIPFSAANANRIWENRVIQARYSIPISLPNLKLLRYINLTPGFSLQGDIYSKKLNYTYLPDSNAVRIDTARGFFPSYNFSVNASMNTRFYGTYFIRGKRIEAIRHTVAPSISFSYVPDFSNPAFGQFQVLPEVGSLTGLPLYRRTLSVFRGLGGSAGSASSTQSAFISFGIVNQLEMKVRTRSDSSGQDFKKIPIFDNLSLTGSYNLLAPDYKLSPIAVSANTQIFKNISFNFSSTFDPYALRPYGGTAYYAVDTYSLSNAPTSPLQYSPLILQTQGYVEGTQEYQRLAGVYAINAGQGLLRLTNLQAYVSARFAPKQADKPKSSPNATDATMRAINNNPELYVDFNIPWSINASYTFGLTKLTPEYSQVVQALTLTGDLSLTPKWKITIQTGYDFQFKSPTLTTIGINRDLHCWEMAFNWTPYSGNNYRSGNYSFDLRARSSILQELKLSRRRSFYDNGGFYGR